MIAGPNQTTFELLCAPVQSLHVSGRLLGPVWAGSLIAAVFLLAAAARCLVAVSPAMIHSRASAAGALFAPMHS